MPETANAPPATAHRRVNRCATGFFVPGMTSTMKGDTSYTKKTPNCKWIERGNAGGQNRRQRNGIRLAVDGYHALPIRVIGQVDGTQLDTCDVTN